MLPELSMMIMTFGWMFAPKMSLSSAHARGVSVNTCTAIMTRAIDLLISVLAPRAGHHGFDPHRAPNTARASPESAAHTAPPREAGSIGHATRTSD
jgi:hypothetical protein